VTVNVTHVSLKRAIDVAAASAHVLVQYQSELVDAYTDAVSLHVTDVSLRAALEQLLASTTLRVVPDGTTRLTLVETGKMAQATTGIAGLVTDVQRHPLRFAVVMLDDSTHMVRTDDDGRYRFVSVNVGTHRVIVRHIGFSQQVRVVTAKENETVVVDFALSANVNTLDQVVVTATGAQRYRELGHIVTKINADSVVREAPVTSLSELLTARVPGLQVMTNNGGIVGGEVGLRIRGTSTLALDPQPIVIVDGVRYKNTNIAPNGSEDYRPFGAEPRSPLNDLSVNDIESVEVVKGPSASTLYGPDASTGVIVVTTKRGKAGKPQWHVYAYPDLTTMSVGSDGQLGQRQSYIGWGHIPNTTTLYDGQCDRWAQAAHNCVFDSVTVAPVPANDPQTSVIAKQRPQWHSGASVSGGTGNLLYFYSGNYDSQTGVLHLSPIAMEELKSRLGVSSLGDAFTSPNSQQSVNLHANISSQLNSRLSVAIVANYTQASQRSIDVTSLFTNQNSPGVQTIAPPGSDSATIANLATSNSQWDAFLNTSQEEVHRMTGTVSGAFQPWPWLHVDGQVGTDIDNTVDRGVRPAGIIYSSDGGEGQESRRDNTNRNAHVGGTATGHPGNWSFRTSAGLDYNYQNQDGLDANAQNLAPGSTDITTGSSQQLGRLWSEVISLGTYAEEVIGLHDRVFLTGSLRLDGSTSFGDRYSPKPFPKVGVSWIASDEPWLASVHRHGLDELRFRYSFGAASRYPTSMMKLGQIDPVNLTVEGETKSGYYRGVLANPTLRPERSREHEYGMDATIWSVVQLGLTWYHRRTDDGLQYVSAPTGFLAGWQNIGDLAAHGVEATLDLKLYQSRSTTLGLRMTYADNRDKVLSIGAGQQGRGPTGGVVVGYPVNSAFGTRTIGYVDSAGGGPDGFITARSEVVSTTTHDYMGPLIAPTTYTVTPMLALVGGRIRITTLFDRQAGGVLYNYYARNCLGNYQCASAFLPTTPLLEQARSIGYNDGDFIQSSNFVRWRELSITGELPLSLRQRLHLSQASASAQIRNLALWTPRFSAPDPENAAGVGVLAVGGNPYGAPGIPQPRGWTIRFDITP